MAPGSICAVNAARASQSGVPRGGARAPDRLHPLELVVALAERCAEQGLDVGRRLLRKKPAVDGDLAERGDDVPLVRRVDHRRREREREERLGERGEHGMELRSARERVLQRRHLAEDGLEEAACLGDELAGRLVGTEGLDVPGSLDECVVRDPRHGRVAASSADPHRERGGPLLGRRAQVDRRAAEHETISAALVDRVVTANCVRVRLDEPAEAVAVVPADAAHLLVRHRDEEEVAARSETLALQRGERDRGGGDLALHVERTAPPHLPVHQFARPRIPVPLGGVREHRVRMGKERERGPAAAREACDDVRAVRLPRVQLDLDPVTREVVTEHLRRPDLVPGRVDGVGPEERLEQGRDLLTEGPAGLRDRH